MIQTALQKTIDGRHLTREEAFGAVETMMTGRATPAQIGAFLVAMRLKGEHPTEIAGFAAAMRKHALPVACPNLSQAVDLVGTGGDGKDSFNISTVASIVAAGAGAIVAKHGNRSVSSKCGSADVLQALGVNIALNAAQAGACLQEAGIAFLYAPSLHPAMKHAIGPRREIGVRSFFNILGPICNPAGVINQVIGVYDRRLAPFLAEVLRQLGSRHVLLVHSHDGFDEIVLSAPTSVVELKDGTIREYDLTPADFGLPAGGEPLHGGDAQYNAAIARSILDGQKGTPRDVVVANAAAGLFVAGLAETLSDGASMAQHSIDSGAARGKLEALRQASRQPSTVYS